MEDSLDTLLDDLCSIGIEDIKIEIDPTTLAVMGIKNKEDLLPELRAFRDIYGASIRTFKVVDSSYFIEFDSITNMLVFFSLGSYKTIELDIGNGSSIVKFDFYNTLNIFGAETPSGSNNTLNFVLWLILYAQKEYEKDARNKYRFIIS